MRNFFCKKRENINNKNLTYFFLSLRLPYTEATIMEIQRMGSIAPQVETTFSIFIQTFKTCQKFLFVSLTEIQQLGSLQPKNIKMPWWEWKKPNKYVLYSFKQLKQILLGVNSYIKCFPSTYCGFNLTLIGSVLWFQLNPNRICIVVWTSGFFSLRLFYSVTQ